MKELREIQKVVIYVIIPFLILALFAVAWVIDIQKQKSAPPQADESSIVVLRIE